MLRQVGEEKLVSLVHGLHEEVGEDGDRNADDCAEDEEDDVPPVPQEVSRVQRCRLRCGVGHLRWRKSLPLAGSCRNSCPSGQWLSTTRQAVSVTTYPRPYGFDRFIPMPASTAASARGVSVRSGGTPPCVAPYRTDSAWACETRSRRPVWPDRLAAGSIHRGAIVHVVAGASFSAERDRRGKSPVQKTAAKVMRATTQRALRRPRAVPRRSRPPRLLALGRQVGVLEADASELMSETKGTPPSISTVALAVAEGGTAGLFGSLPRGSRRSGFR